jgi:hypothetical protein
MLTGAHMVVYSTNVEADRAFFGVPPAELAVHEGEANGRHELYLMCADVAAFVAEMKKRGIACTAVEDEAGASSRRSRFRAAASSASTSHVTPARPGVSETGDEAHRPRPQQNAVSRGMGT